MKMRRFTIFVLAIALAIGSVTGQPLAQDAARGSQVSVDNIARHVDYLASDKLQGRRTGEPGADLAAKYIAEEFRRYGLQPLASKSFFQPFTFVASVRLGQQNSFQVKGADGARALKLRQEYMPLAFSASDPVSGPLVFAGFGISAPELQYDNYAGADVTGKVVMILRGSPDGENPHGRFADFSMPGPEIQNKTIKAREKGARAVIFVSDQKQFQEDRLARLRHDLNFLDAGLPVVVVSREAAESLLSSAGQSLADLQKRAEKEAAPLALSNLAVELKTEVVKVNGSATNVIGVLKGSDPRLSSEYVVIGGHYDHLGLGGPESLAQNPEGSIHHGADDNASGTSAILELARVLAKDPSKVKRSVVFVAFSGEELGLLGSAAYTKNPLFPLASTTAMLNLDMVGRLRNNALSVGGVGTSPAWKPLVERLNGQSRFRLSMGQDGFGPSDHQSFYVRDIPVLFFFTGTHDDYHKPSDTAEKVNAEGIKQVADFVGEIALAVANEPERIAFTRVQTQSRPTGRGFRVYLGTVPNYSDQEEGLKLDGVRSGSPAERAGLRPGDVITRLANRPVKNVYDYTYVLGEMRGGEEVDVIIRREGREMTLKLTPEKRQ